MSWFASLGGGGASLLGTPAPISPAQLMQAAIKGDAEDVAKLLNSGADCNHRGDFGATPLIRASEQGHTPVVALLLRHKSKVNAQDDNGDSALLWACRMGHIDAVRALLAAGADPGLTNSQGTNAMDAALEARNLLGRPEVSELLVGHRRVAGCDHSGSGDGGSSSGGGADGRAAATAAAEDGRGGSQASAGASGVGAGADEAAPPSPGGASANDSAPPSAASSTAPSPARPQAADGSTPTIAAPVLRLRREDWAQDRNYPQCHLCKESFTVFKRRHHCRICGLVFCEKCTSNSLTAVADGGQPRLAEGEEEKEKDKEGGGAGGGGGFGGPLGFFGGGGGNPVAPTVIRVRVCSACAALHAAQPFAQSVGQGVWRLDEKSRGHTETRDVGSSGLASSFADRMRHAAAPALAHIKTAVALARATSYEASSGLKTAQLPPTAAAGASGGAAGASGADVTSAVADLADGAAGSASGSGAAGDEEQRGSSGGDDAASGRSDFSIGDGGRAEGSSEPPSPSARPTDGDMKGAGGGPSLPAGLVGETTGGGASHGDSGGVATSSCKRAGSLGGASSARRGSLPVRLPGQMGDGESERDDAGGGGGGAEGGTNAGAETVSQSDTELAKPFAGADGGSDGSGGADRVPRHRRSNSTPQLPPAALAQYQGGGGGVLGGGVPQEKILQRGGTYKAVNPEVPGIPIPDPTPESVASRDEHQARLDGWRELRLRQAVWSQLQVLPSVPSRWQGTLELFATRAADSLTPDPNASINSILKIKTLGEHPQALKSADEPHATSYTLRATHSLRAPLCFFLHLARSSLLRIFSHTPSAPCNRCSDQPTLMPPLRVCARSWRLPCRLPLRRRPRLPAQARAQVHAHRARVAAHPPPQAASRARVGRLLLLARRPSPARG